MNDPLVPTTAPALRNVHGVYCGVREFGPTVRAFRDGFGWSVVDFDEIPIVEARSLWGVESEVQVLTLAAAPGCPNGLVHLLKLSDEATPAPRGGPAFGDFGYLSVAVQVRDIHETVRRAQLAGARLVGEVASFDIQRANDQLHLNSAFVELPDDLNVYLAQTSDPRPTWTWTELPDAPVTELNFVIYQTPEMERTVDWWGEDGMGLPKSHTAHITTDVVSRMHGAAPGLDLTNGVLATEESTRVEILGPNLEQHGGPRPLNRDLRSDQAPGTALGQVMWRCVLTERPASFARWAEERQATVMVLPVRRISKHFADRTVGVVEGPTGQRVQIEMPG